MTVQQSKTQRRNKRDLVADYFRQHPSQPLNSFDLHMRFGSGLRTRISELNNDPDGDLTIRNHVYCAGNAEISLYTASPRRPTPASAPTAPTPTEESLFGDLSPKGSYPD